MCSDIIRKAAGQEKLTGAIFLDLTRAFDTINHGALLNKLMNFGVYNIELNWLRYICSKESS